MKRREFVLGGAAAQSGRRIRIAFLGGGMGTAVQTWLSCADHPSGKWSAFASRILRILAKIPCKSVSFAD